MLALTSWCSCFPVDKYTFLARLNHLRIKSVEMIVWGNISELWICAFGTGESGQKGSLQIICFGIQILLISLSFLLCIYPICLRGFAIPQVSTLYILYYLCAYRIHLVKEILLTDNCYMRFPYRITPGFIRIRCLVAHLGYLCFSWTEALGWTQ